MVVVTSYAVCSQVCLFMLYLLGYLHRESGCLLHINFHINCFVLIALHILGRNLWYFVNVDVLSFQLLSVAIGEFPSYCLALFLTILVCL